jgi:hypothetical protein
MKDIFQTALMGLLLMGSTVLAADGGKVWTDPALATKEDPDFTLQGEYASPKDSKEEGVLGAQVVALGAGHFRLVRYPGGLPRAGWDGKHMQVFRGDAHDGTVQFKIAGDEEELTLSGGKLRSSMSGEAVRVERTSPTEGAKPPAGATVLFDGTKASLTRWVKGSLDGELLKEGTQTAADFGSFKLHIEFRVPFKPDTPVGNQDRGNSGVYIYDRYEVQVIDSFGLQYFHQPADQWAKAFTADFGIKPPSDRVQWVGALYHQKGPDVNMAFPPLAWQTYDIDFTAAKFDADRKKTANARITVLHNGVKIQDNVELPHGTGAAASRPELAKGPIVLQEHHNPVRYRNIWIVPKE